LESELIESDDLTTSGQDTGTGSLSDAEGADLELGDLQETNVIGDGTDDNSGLVGTCISLHLADQAGQRHWWTVDARHKETLQDDLVEVGAGAAGQEAVGLDEETKVDILGDWSVAVWALLVVTLVVTDIDTHGSRFN